MIKFSLSKVAAGVFLSIKVTFAAPLERHSIPKDPVPEYRSRIFEFNILTLMRFEWFRILKILSLTESFSGLVFKFLKN